MSGALRVKAAGLLTTVQDQGRPGWLRYGLSASGPLDSIAMAIANAVVGNPDGAAALELTLTGPTLLVEDQPVRIAIAGADLPLKIDSQLHLAHCSHRVMPGQTIAIGPAHHGARAYLAVAGGFALDPQLGSVASHSRAGLGYRQGRPLAAGDRLEVAGSADGPDHLLDAAFPPPPGASWIRVMLGPQDDYFTEAAVNAFLTEEFTVSNQADRMGYRLSGPTLGHAKGFNIVSDAITVGSIQVPGHGDPILLLADRQATGGYPKIATVIGADLAALGQKRPGDRLRFAAVTAAEAAAARQRQTEWLARMRAAIQPAVDRHDSEWLLGQSLISGVTDATRER